MTLTIIGFPISSVGVAGHLASNENEVLEAELPLVEIASKIKQIINSAHSMADQEDLYYESSGSSSDGDDDIKYAHVVCNEPYWVTITDDEKIEIFGQGNQNIVLTAERLDQVIGNCNFGVKGEVSYLDPFLACRVLNMNVKPCVIW